MAKQPFEDEAVISTFEARLKAGSMLDVHGFLKYVQDKDFDKKVIQCLKDGGLYSFVNFGYKYQHIFDANQFYLNARISKDENKDELDEIISRVNGVDVTIVQLSSQRRGFPPKLFLPRI